MIDLINRMEADGSLKRLINAGLMSYKICFHKQLYEHYFRAVKSGVASNKAAIDTSIEFRISKRSVWRAVKTMSQA